jgi:hypothetical protein
MKTLGPVGSQWAGLTVSVHAELLAVGALLSTLCRRDCLLRAGGQADSAKSARKLALLGLVLAVAAGSAQVDNFVEVLTDRATL